MEKKTVTIGLYEQENSKTVKTLKKTFSICFFAFKHDLV